jgi:hypothetical protein
MAVCRSCGAEIMWALTDQAHMPIDADPVPDGNLLILGYEPDGTAVVRYVPPGGDIPGDRYRSHFASCPHAGAWRRR